MQRTYLVRDARTKELAAFFSRKPASSFLVVENVNRRGTEMLKCSINNKGNIAELIHDCVCDKNVEEIGLSLIDTLIYSEYVHDSAKYKDLTQREQDEIIQSIRNRLLDEMKKQSSMCQRDCSVINIMTNI